MLWSRGGSTIRQHIAELLIKFYLQLKTIINHQVCFSGHQVLLFIYLSVPWGSGLIVVTWKVEALDHKGVYYLPSTSGAQPIGGNSLYTPHVMSPVAPVQRCLPPKLDFHSVPDTARLLWLYSISAFKDLRPVRISYTNILFCYVLYVMCFSHFVFNSVCCTSNKGLL